MVLCIDDYWKIEKALESTFDRVDCARVCDRVNCVFGSTELLLDISELTHTSTVGTYINSIPKCLNARICNVFAVIKYVNNPLQLHSIRVLICILIHPIPQQTNHIIEEPHKCDQSEAVNTAGAKNAFYVRVTIEKFTINSNADRQLNIFRNVTNIDTSTSDNYLPFFRGK